MTMPGGPNFGAPFQPMSPFGFMGAGPIGMNMQQMMAQMQPQIPQIGGMMGPMAQQAMNMAFPIMQQMMAQRQMAQGLAPIGIGGGSPFQQMQAMQFRQTTEAALNLVQQRDMARLAAVAPGPLGEFLVGAQQVPGLGGFAQQFLAPLIAPQGVESDIMMGLVAATRGRVDPKRLDVMSARIFSQFSRTIKGKGDTEVDILDLSKTGGLTAGQLGELAFELNRRGGGAMFNDQAAAALLGGEGGDPAFGDLTGQQRTARIQEFQTAAITTRIKGLKDVLGVVDEMMGGGGAISQLLDTIESISNKNITASGVNVGAIQRQFENMRGMADVMGIAPQAMLSMTQAMSVNLRQQGFSGMLAQPLVARQLSQINAGAGVGLGITGLSATRTDLSRAAAVSQMSMLQSVEGSQLGQLRAVQEAGLGGDALNNFFRGSAAAQLSTLQDPGAFSGLLSDLRAGTNDPRALEAILGSDARQFLTGADIDVLAQQEADLGFGTINMLLGGDKRAAGIVAAARGGTLQDLSRADRVMFALTAGAFEARMGMGLGAFVTMSSTAGRRRAKLLRLSGNLRGAVIGGINQLGRAGPGAFERAVSSGFSPESIMEMITGGSIDLMELKGTIGGEGGAAVDKLLETSQASLTKIMGDKDLTEEEKRMKVEDVQNDTRRKLLDLTWGAATESMSKEQLKKALSALDKNLGDGASGADDPKTPGKDKAAGRQTASKLTIEIITGGTVLATRELEIGQDGIVKIPASALSTPIMLPAGATGVT